MADFDAYIEEAVEMVGEQRKKIPSGKGDVSLPVTLVPEAYYTGYIYGLRASKLIFKEYEQNCRGDSMKFLVYRDDTEDGVVGLNGRQYLLEADNSLMRFDTTAEAVQFLADEGVDIEADELMHIIKETE